MFDHFQAEDDWEPTVLRSQVVIGRTSIKLEFGMLVLRLGDALH